MNDKPNDDDDPVSSAVIALRQERKDILSLSAENALNRILEAKHPAALVHSLPEEDFYFLVHDLGPEDALSLLALASNKQREYILDMVTWYRDQLQLKPTIKWLYLMILADPRRTTSWLLSEKSDLLTLFLFRNIQVIIREHDQDPSVFGEGFFTYDDTYYIRILDAPPSSEEEDNGGETEDAQRRFLLQRMLALLAEQDHFLYQQLLVAAAHALPAELEEEEYRLRNIRLAEKGFLPFDEAVGIYHPPKADAFKKQSEKSFGRSEASNEMPPTPHYPVSLLQEGSLFVDALQAIQPGPALEQIQTEFAALCNQVISADQRQIIDKIELSQIVKKACGYLNIGLEALSEDSSVSKTAPKMQTMASFIQRSPLTDIFQFGYNQALQLKWRAQRWRKTAWFESNGLPLTFWGESWLGVLGGLLLEKPLCYDNFQTGETLYRDFSSLSDVEAAAQVLDQIMAVDALIAAMQPVIGKIDRHFITYKNLVLTLWATHERHRFDGKSGATTLTPLSLVEFRSFFSRLFEPDQKGAASPYRTTLEMKKAFLKWLSNCCKTSPDDITLQIGSALDELFEEVDAELGQVSIADLDPRFIHLFWIY